MNPSSSLVENTPQPCRQSTKPRTMIVNIKTKMVVKFEASEMMCVELRAQSYEMCTHIAIHCIPRDT